LKIAVVSNKYSTKEIAGLLHKALSICANPNPEVWVLGNTNEQFTWNYETYIADLSDSQAREPNCLIAAITFLCRVRKADIVIMSSGSIHNSIINSASLAAGYSSMTDVFDCHFEDNKFLSSRPVYAANMLMTKSMALPCMLTVTHSKVKSVVFQSSSSPISTTILHIPNNIFHGVNVTALESFSSHFSLSDAERVIVMGKGVGNHFEEVEHLAKLMDAHIGATRPETLDCQLGLSRLVGLSGKKISPDLCLVLGASGAAAFLAGIENSKFIIAVNTDPAAPIFRNCDVGIVADWHDFTNHLIELLENRQ